MVQTGENMYFQTDQKTSPIWFRPLLLVQTTKTWSIPSFSRLLRPVRGVRVREAEGRAPRAGSTVDPATVSSADLDPIF